jgi:uncharacterized membrane protein
MGARTWGGRIAVASRLGLGHTVALAVLAALALGCMESRSTEPSTGDPAFAKAGGASDPTVESADPATAPQDTTLDVHVFGTNYDGGSRVDFSRGGVVDPKLQVNSTTFRSSRELVANVTVAPDASTVFYDIVVTKSTGKKGIGTEKFAVLVQGEMLSSPSGQSWATSVSENGLVSGYVMGVCGTVQGGVLWDQLGQLTVLPGLPGTCGSVARDVNSSGVAVGRAFGSNSSESVDVRWLPSGGTYRAESLPRLPDGSLALVYRINEAGLVVAANAAAVWSEATGWQMLPRPSGATTCKGDIAINDIGAIAGNCTIAGQDRAVYWPSASGSPVVLPLPVGGGHPLVGGINDIGMIVGSVAITMRTNGSRNALWHAIRWNPSGGSWTAELLPDLGKGGHAEAINDAGQIAGAVFGTNDSPLPVLWEASGARRQLDTGNRGGQAHGLAEPAAGSVVVGAIDIPTQSWHAARWRP